MVIILRNRDMKGSVTSGAIKPLEDVTLDDVLDARCDCCAEATTVIYLPEDCDRFVVLKDALQESAGFVISRDPDLIHKVIMFGTATTKLAA